MTILVLGVTGMLGSAVYRLFSQSPAYQVFGTLRSESGRRFFSEQCQESLLSGIDVLDQDVLIKLLARIKPDVVINCVGLIKQLENANNPLSVLPINAMLPHRLANLCELSNSRLIQISTDCVFSGNQGMYTEGNASDATDLYGQSKYIGELREEGHAVTLRTSIIGHELNSAHSLIDWFLMQNNSVKGYAKAIFSGLPTVELARVIRDFVIPQQNLRGLYHVSADPINKLSLLQLVAKIYGKEIEIIPDDRVQVDRSLDSTCFRKLTGYEPSDWPALIQQMYDNR